jgi:hypothetical protein
MLDQLLDCEGARSDDESGVVRWILVTDVRFDGDKLPGTRHLSAVIGATEDVGRAARDAW